MNERAAVIIPAAGSGSRMQSAVPKQFLKLAGVPLLVHTVRVFHRCPVIHQIIVAVAVGRQKEAAMLLDEFGPDGPDLLVVAGGDRRQDSVQAGLAHLREDIEVVLVHDGARPCVSADLIERCFREIVSSGAAIAAVPVKDTLKRAVSGDLVDVTVDRTGLWQAQTPQGARTGLLRRAFAACGERTVTDEAAMLEAAAIPVRLVAGEETNIKITRQEDLLLAEAIMTQQPATHRIGHGFDAHRFADGRALVLGGVVIEHPRGLAGHSDADVLTHALCDALLGAAASGDIGRHFPDSDERYRGVCSLDLLDSVIETIAGNGYRLANADITLVCQAPKLAPHIETMRDNLARRCRTGREQISIKATTTENMGYTGREEGIGCHAVVLLEKRETSTREKQWT